MQSELHKKLMDIGYCSNNKIDFAVEAAIESKKPLLIEGDPGVGKSSLAESVAKALNMEFIRVQLYDGLTDDKIMYDYDYQKQLLVLEAVKPFIENEYKNQNIQDVISSVSHELNFYGKDFLIERPILKAINGKGRKVLLLDEIDKASEEIEYMLYEFLENYSITIPQFGKYDVDDDMKPIVFLTSNNYRELSGALKRRCNYLYIERKSEIELIEILQTRVNVDEQLAKGIAKCLTSASVSNLSKPPSISEGIEWAKYLKNGHNSKEDVLNSLSFIIKSKKDMDKMTDIVERIGDLIYGV